jgi:hypothetical protein
MFHYQKWMASTSHREIFKKVAQFGFLPTLVLGTTTLLGPWFWWAIVQNYSSTVFLAGLVAILAPGSVVLVALARYFPVLGCNVWVTVEVERGVLALHIWKNFPSRQVLGRVVAEAVQIGLDLGLKVVRIESPLLVRESSFRLWGEVLRSSLVRYGDRIRVIDLPARNMFFLRAALFAATRKIAGYDKENKHLPEPAGIAGKTAGFRIELR